MPCRDDYGPDSFDGIQRRANLNARVACSALRILEERGFLRYLTDEGRKWWDEHKAADAARERREQEERTRRQLARRARNKLTPDERKALGLN